MNFEKISAPKFTELSNEELSQITGGKIWGKECVGSTTNENGCTAKAYEYYVLGVCVKRWADPD
ncbi:MAG: ComC/BlpC family leader-containing pheromone/bacteriocin [Bacteroidales bacterium]|nr:ComC/BlpC family leader-containing pheromone/bacteriocin [Bacteroidales bacterium]MBN2749201.1 ComC/BlpC family leader-containing pheromone/bacteriocin [Bacteroidales bacterium]